MDSILVFDDFKHCFRELDTSNYNDDLVVGSVFFTRDAINVIEKYYRIIGYIICDDKGVYYPIDVRKNDIAILEGTYNCMSLSCRMYFRQSSVFLANRLMDLVIIISMLPALQSSIM